MTPNAALERLKHLPIEPETLPDGFSLYERFIESLELSDSDEAVPGDDRGDALAEPASSLVLDYRHHGSPHVPALTLIETRNPAGPLAVLLTEKRCGEIIRLPEGNVFYGKGGGAIIVDDNEHDYYVCPSEGPPNVDIHTAYIAKRDLLIEIKAFPEARVTKEDILKMAASMLSQIR